MKAIFLTLILMTSSAWADESPAASERIGSIFVFGPNLTVSESIFIEKEDSVTTGDLTTETRFSDSSTDLFEMFGNDFDYGKSVSRSLSQKITNSGGDFILVSTRVSKTDYEHGNDSFTIANRVDIKNGNRKLEYIGTISKFGDFPESIENSVTYIETADFDPCSLEQTSLVKIKGAIDNITPQVKQSLRATCVVGESLSGDFFTNLVLTDQDGTVIKKIELTGSLTLKVSKALTIKYGRSYLNGEDPLEDLFGSNFQTQSELPVQQSNSQLFGAGIEVGNVYFVNREHIQGKIHEFNISHTSEAKNSDDDDDDEKDNEDGCSTNKNLNLKLEEHLDSTIKNEVLYTFSIRRECKANNYVESRISNAFDQDGERAVVLSYTKNTEVADELSASRMRFNIDVANRLGSDEWFTNFNITHRRFKSNGMGSETGFDVFYAQDLNSYVVAKHILISPVFGSQSFKTFRQQAITDEEPINLKDVDLCFKIDCKSIGAAVTFKEDGGLFLSAEGKTVLQVFDTDVDFSLTGGFGLNGEAENEGFGSGSFFNNDEENFVELRLGTPSCTKPIGACASLGFRKEETSTNLIFGGSLKF